ncbi:hypothetical protein Y1Q_0007827 [Alligator mississippiensis]|uniref:Uncharacterized protein n=1 Tax=Alligator mississippiensis TaxID=8496 RepID=A0A151N735_ALLMI|nr:hypothetical protein Y1Q_0007827 [Alligator mississippiensis]
MLFSQYLCFPSIPLKSTPPGGIRIGKNLISYSTLQGRETFVLQTEDSELLALPPSDCDGRSGEHLISESK